jgi:hypothetical protein
MVPVESHPYRRSAFQIAVLLFVTGGLYVFVWAFYVRRSCAELLERDDQSLWKSIALIVPIFNFFLMFDLGKMIEGVSWRAAPERPQSNALPWLGVSSFLIGILWRLPNGFWTLSLLDFIPLALMHLAFERAQLSLAGESARPTRFKWPEWIVLVLGTVFWVLALVGISMPDDAGDQTPYWWVGYVVAIIAIGTFVAIRLTERRHLTAATPENPPR